MYTAEFRERIAYHCKTLKLLGSKFMLRITWEVTYVEINLALLQTYADDAIISKGRILAVMLVLIAYIKFFGAVPNDSINTLLIMIATATFIKVSIEYALVIIDMNYLDFVEVDVSRVISDTCDYDEIVTTDEYSYFFEHDEQHPIPENTDKLKMIVTKRSRLPVMLNILER